MSNLKYVAITADLATRLKDRQHHAIFYSSGPGNYIPTPKRWKAHATELDWRWSDHRFVKLPLSCEYRTRSNKLKWDIIQQELTIVKSLCDDPSIANLGDRFGDAIRHYNRTLVENTDFHILSDPELNEALRRILPLIITEALNLPYQLGEGIPLLRQRESGTIYVTRKLVSSLLAHCFLCTVPHSVRSKDLPYFHCLKLFHDGKEDGGEVRLKKEKLKCLLDYFFQMSLQREDEDHIISFERRWISPIGKNWFKSTKTLCKVDVVSNKGIEEADGMLQADFANKFVGGGVLGKGMVQEEIRFAICPELILARLFTEVLGDDEVLIVTGVKQFSSYSGYGGSFQQKGLREDRTMSVDSLGREYTQVVAMDALYFPEGKEWTQYEKKNIDRELHKSYVAFSPGGRHVGPVATGNWGCGVFNGDPQLKLLLQWLAASEAGRPLIAFHVTSDQVEELKWAVRFLTQKQVSVGNLYKALVKYESDVGHRKGVSVFQYLGHVFR